MKLGKCKLCGNDLVAFNYVVLSMGKNYPCNGVKCSNCDYKVPKDVEEVKK